ncbi:MAG: hypothetical protein MUC36_22255 [Planctomycetes bacterium]|jgi:hypothetical protein|nr:hypothetical protein [Planctomycetota bacterium]
MSTADDDVLATDGGPDDANARAELAVLDMALSERFGDRATRDLWPGTAARLMRARTTAQGRMQPWLLAAGMVLGLGVVTAMALWRPGSSPEAPTTSRQGPHDPSTSLPNGPSNLAELQARVAAATEIRMLMRGVWSAELGRWVTIPRHALDNLFQPTLHPALEPDLVERVKTAIAESSQAPGRASGATMPVWSHHLALANPLRAILVLRIGGDAPSQLGFLTPTGAELLHAPDFPFAELTPVAERTTAATIPGLGLVIGPGGFAAVPTTKRNLRLFDVPATAVGELQRYPSLRSLDLTAAPAFHDAGVLRALSALPIEELTLAPHRLDAAAFQTLGAMRTLHELFLVDFHPLHVLMDRRPTTAAPKLDDAALRGLGELTQLRELTLAGGSFTDAGLQSLATLPIRSLNLFDCGALRGESLAMLSQVRSLLVRGGQLGPAAASQLAAMPNLGKLYLMDAAAGVPLGPLATAGQLKELVLLGPLARNELPGLTALTSLRSLGLGPEPPFTDEQLTLLHGLRQLQRLRVLAISATQRTALGHALPGVNISDEF